MIVQLQLQAQARLSVLFAPLCIFSAVTLTPAAAAATNMPCDPENCVVAKFDFQVAELECSSCTPESSRWRCPARNNVYGPAFEATFDEKGFGDWTLQQCIYKEYEPGFLAFAGPGAYADYFVTACPSAVYCACGDVKTKIKVSVHVCKRCNYKVPTLSYVIPLISIEVNDLPKLDPILDQTSALLAVLDDTVDAL